MNGEVVGVVTSKLSAVNMLRTAGDLPQNVNYAVKIPYLRDLLSKREKAAGPEQPPLGRGSLEVLVAFVKRSIMLVTTE